MTAERNGKDDLDPQRWPAVETLHSTFIALCILTMGFTPLAIPAMVPALALLSIWDRSTQRGLIARAESFAGTPVVISAALFFGYALLASLWSKDPGFASGSVMRVAGAATLSVISAFLISARLSELHPIRRNRFLRALPLAAPFPIAYILIEQWTGFALTRSFLDLMPWVITHDANEIVRQDGRIVGLNPFAINRNVSLMALVLPATISAALLWLPGSRGRVLALLLASAAAAAVFQSVSAASKVALVVSALVALATLRAPIPTVRALKMIVAAGILLALPLGHLPKTLGLDHARWLAPSAHERVIIWDATASAVRNAPLFGIGPQSTRFTESAPITIPGIIGERRSLGWHAHNIVLQTWLELGAVGALLLLALVYSVLSAVERLTAPARLAGLATFAAAAALALTGWGMWQPWLVASFGMSAVLIAVLGVADTTNCRPNDMRNCSLVE